MSPIIIVVDARRLIVAPKCRTIKNKISLATYLNNTKKKKKSKINEHLVQ